MISKAVLGAVAAAVVAAMALLPAGVAQATISIPTVTVGNTGNTADPTTGYGSVSYSYDIGKYEVTTGQYTAFLNAVAATDTYGLYNTNMADPSTTWVWGCNIQRSGSSGSYTYSVASDWANRPVNYVSFGDAMRFANWLQNGQRSGAEDLTTTEDGAYYVNGATTDAQLQAVSRKTGWQWAVTDKNEWYKAAYYSPTTGTYYTYPASTNSITTAMANYNHSWLGNPQDVGSYAYPSPYGTFDQAGNVAEWNEATLGAGIMFRFCEGGSFSSSSSVLQSVPPMNIGGPPTNEDGTIGFRVVEVPEPATLSLLALGGLALLRRRHRT